MIQIFQWEKYNFNISSAICIYLAATILLTLWTSNSLISDSIYLVKSDHFPGPSSEVLPKSHKCIWVLVSQKAALKWSDDFFFHIKHFILSKWWFFELKKWHKSDLGKSQSIFLTIFQEEKKTEINSSSLLVSSFHSRVAGSSVQFSVCSGSVFWGLRLVLLNQLEQIKDSFWVPSLVIGTFLTGQ